MEMNTVRAWKDEAYRQSLSEEALKQLPESPVGELELSDADLAIVHGGNEEGNAHWTWCHCTSWSWWCKQGPPGPPPGPPGPPPGPPGPPPGPPGPPPGP